MLATVMEVSSLSVFWIDITGKVSTVFSETYPEKSSTVNDALTLIK